MCRPAQHRRRRSPWRSGSGRGCRKALYASLSLGRPSQPLGTTSHLQLSTPDFCSRGCQRLLVHQSPTGHSGMVLAIIPDTPNPQPPHRRHGQSPPDGANPYRLFVDGSWVAPTRGRQYHFHLQSRRLALPPHCGHPFHGAAPTARIGQPTLHDGTPRYHRGHGNSSPVKTQQQIDLHRYVLQLPPGPERTLGAALVQQLHSHKSIDERGQLWRDSVLRSNVT